MGVTRVSSILISQSHHVTLVIIIRHYRIKLKEMLIGTTPQMNTAPSPSATKQVRTNDHVPQMALVDPPLVHWGRGGNATAQQHSQNHFAWHFHQ